MAELFDYHEYDYTTAIVGVEKSTNARGVVDVPVTVDLSEAKHLRLFGIEVELEFDDLVVDENSMDTQEYIEVYSADYDEYFQMDNPNYDPDYKTLDDLVSRYNDNYWQHFERDGSLNAGFEIVSEPLTFDMAIKYVNKQCLVDPWEDSLGHNGTNGCHIHVYDNKKLYKTRLAYMMCAMQDRLQNLTRYSDYARPYSDDLGDNFISKLVNRKEEIFKTKSKMLNCLGRNNHVEFRFFRVPDSEFSETMEKYLKFVNQIIDLSHDFNMNQLMKFEFDVDDDFNIVMTQTNFTDDNLWDMAKIKFDTKYTDRFNDDYVDGVFIAPDNLVPEERFLIELTDLVTFIDSNDETTFNHGVIESRLEHISENLPDNLSERFSKELVLFALSEFRNRNINRRGLRNYLSSLLCDVWTLPAVLDARLNNLNSRLNNLWTAS